MTVSVPSESADPSLRMSIHLTGSQVASDKDNKHIGRAENFNGSTPPNQLESTQRSKSGQLRLTT